MIICRKGEECTPQIDTEGQNSYTKLSWLLVFSLYNHKIPNAVFMPFENKDNCSRIPLKDEWI